jgi:hypothetical protein
MMMLWRRFALGAHAAARKSKTHAGPPPNMKRRIYDLGVEITNVGVKILWLAP